MERIVLLEAGGQLFGVPITTVREIVPAVRATPLPGAGAHVRGLINLRGQVVTVVNLAALRDLDERREVEPESVVLVEVGERLVGLEVTRVVRIISDSAEVDGAEDDIHLTREAGIMGGEGEGETQAVYTMVDPEDLLTPLFA